MEGCRAAAVTQPSLSRQRFGGDFWQPQIRFTGAQISSCLFGEQFVLGFDPIEFDLRQFLDVQQSAVRRLAFDPAKHHVTRGYGVLQPRVAVNLASASRTRFVKLFSG